MDGQKKKLLIGAGVVLGLLWLLSRSRGSSGAASRAAAVDPNQQLAQQLTAQRQYQQAQLDYSAAAVAQNEANTLSQFNFFKQIAADPAYACPNGGRPRWIAGQGPGCIEKRSGAITFGSLLGAAEQAFTVFAGGGRGGGGGTQNRGAGQQNTPNGQNPPGVLTVSF